MNETDTMAIKAALGVIIGKLDELMDEIVEGRADRDQMRLRTAEKTPS
jgi:hypothetical protein